MNFLRKLFIKKQAQVIEPTDFHQDTAKYEMGILKRCLENREDLIKRIAQYELKDIDQGIRDFEDELVIIKITDTPLMCRIVEEKLLQFKKAKMLLEKNKAETSPL